MKLLVTGATRRPVDRGRRRLRADTRNRDVDPPGLGAWAELDWRPGDPLRAGLRETVDWHRDNRWWWEPVRLGDHRDYYRRQYGPKLRLSSQTGGVMPVVHTS